MADADAPRPGLAWYVRTVLAVVARPDLWVTAARQALRLARRGWWRRPPFLPLPSGPYLRFRLVTMYGGAAPEPADVVDYLRWCRAWPALVR